MTPKLFEFPSPWEFAKNVFPWVYEPFKLLFGMLGWQGILLIVLLLVFRRKITNYVNRIRYRQSVEGRTIELLEHIERNTRTK